MKESDKKILQYIRNNSRINLTTLSRRTGIPVSTIFDRLRAYEGKTVRKFTALLDFTALGYTTRMKLFLKVHPEQREKIRNYLLAHENVNNLWRINNGYDFIADCVFRDLVEAEDFCDALEVRFEIMERKVHHVIASLAREKVLAGWE